MGLQAILERIRNTGEAQVQEIRTQSERDVQAILSEAQAEAQQEYQAAYRQGVEPEAGACARILNQARFEAVCLAGQARESLVEAALVEVYRQLQEARSRPDYPVVLRQMLLEVLPGQNGLHSVEDRLILEADVRDREILERLLREANLPTPVEYCLHSWGGLIARSPDGTTRLVNTLEARLEQVLLYLKQQMVARFEQAQPLEEIHGAHWADGA